MHRHATSSYYKYNLYRTRTYRILIVRPAAASRRQARDDEEWDDDERKETTMRVTTMRKPDEGSAGPMRRVSEEEWTRREGVFLEEEAPR